MVIEIIKIGNLSGDKKYRFDCPNCGCRIKCSKSDIIYEDRPCGGSFVICPTCGKHMVEKRIRKNLT